MKKRIKTRLVFVNDLNDLSDYNCFSWFVLCYKKLFKSGLQKINKPTKMRK